MEKDFTFSPTPSPQIEQNLSSIVGMALLLEDNNDLGDKWSWTSFVGFIESVVLIVKSFKEYKIYPGYVIYIAPEDVHPNSAPSGKLVLFSDQFKYGM